MTKPRTDAKREKRIEQEIVVDAYDEWERAMGWFYYLEQILQFPFRAECVKEREQAPLRVGEKVEVIGMPPEEVCARNRAARGHPAGAGTRWVLNLLAAENRMPPKRPGGQAQWAKTRSSRKTPDCHVPVFGWALDTMCIRSSN